ncbi:MAG: ribonuclease HII [Lentisphaerae bacterium]|nr:ribonuclease HII [Lentisphaerota bacterium]
MGSRLEGGTQVPPLSFISGGQPAPQNGAAAFSPSQGKDRVRTTTDTTERDMFEHEREARRAHPGLVLAGVDEAGRGPLAGPVVAAAVILPENGFDLPVTDSKALSATEREELAAALRTAPGVMIAIAVRDAARIDEVNILQATHEAMREAAAALPVPPGLVLIDGLPVRPFPFPIHAIVKGDASSASIAAASIIAKTHRDYLMCAYDRDYPGYGFAQHKGYGTAQHLQALRELGPCPLHRRSFAPVRDVLLAPTQPCLPGWQG